jgi:hypothetical protein
MVSKPSDAAMQAWMECHLKMTQGALSLWEGEATSLVWLASEEGAEAVVVEAEEEVEEHKQWEGFHCPASCP